MIRHLSTSLLYSLCIKTKIHKPTRNPKYRAVPGKKKSIFGKKSLHTSHTISVSIWNLPSRKVTKATPHFSENSNQCEIAVPPFSCKWNISDQRKAYPAVLLFLYFNISSFIHTSVCLQFCFVYSQWLHFTHPIHHCSQLTFAFLPFFVYSLMFSPVVLASYRLQIVTYMYR